MNKYFLCAYEGLTMLLPTGLACLFLRNKGVGIRKREKIWLLFFSLYLMSVLHFTESGTLYDLLRLESLWKPKQINICPFCNTIDLKAYVLNIILFLPLGIFISACMKMRSIGFAFGIGMAFSGFIEVTQMLNNRRSDVDDIILNTLGTVLGFLLCDPLKKISNRKPSEGNISLMFFVILSFFLFAGRFLFYNEIWFAGLLYGF